MNETDFITLLSKKYSGPSYGFISKVRNQTGYSNQNSNGIRTADGLAMSLWPSQGLDLYGFEIKTSRGDFLNEIKHPEKSDEIAKKCDFWFIVAPKKMIDISELLPTWGLIEPSGNGLKIVKTGERIKSEPIDRYFLASLFRSLSDGVVQKSEVQQIIRDKVKEKLSSEEWSAKYEFDKRKEYTEKLEKFEKLSGFKIDYLWESNIEKLAAGIKILMEGDDIDFSIRLERLKETALEIVDDIDKRLSIKKTP
jgi:hypothetical protein